MPVLQISLDEETYCFAKDLLIKAQGSFQLEGDKYTLGATFLTILEEWSKSKGFIKKTSGEKKKTSIRELILNDPTEKNFVMDLILNVDRRPNATNSKALFEYVRKLDPSWRVSNGESTTKGLVKRAREIIEEFEGI